MIWRQIIKEIHGVTPIGPSFICCTDCSLILCGKFSFSTKLYFKFNELAEARETLLVCLLAIGHIPTVGIWTSWEDFQPCTATCGFGTREKSRHCFGGQTCSGERQKTLSCVVNCGKGLSVGSDLCLAKIHNFINYSFKPNLGQGKICQQQR